MENIYNAESNSAWIIVRRMRLPFLIIILTFSISILGLMLIPGRDANGHIYHMSFFDAFYFVSYMASTIGFGEIPYEFTYPQRIWVSMTIFLGVIGWFYAIGTIVALIQDKRLARELTLTKFKKVVNSLVEDFIIVLGYNNITKDIIYRLNKENIRVVVIDKDEEKINELELENFNPIVPAITGDASNPDILKISGIHKKNCKAVIALFEDDAKNAKVALLVKLLNKRVKTIVKSTTKEQTQNLQNIGIRHIENPFEIISKRIHLAFTKPHIWTLLMWVGYGHILKIRKREVLPKGKYIVCGYGRMGQSLENELENELEKVGIETAFIDVVAKEYKDSKQTQIYGDAEDINTLIKAGIQEANAIVAATQDDLINLTILSTAKKLNPNIYTIARENSLEDISIFKAAKIDRVYILEKILADVTFNFLAKPLIDNFIKLIRLQDDEWGKKTIEKIKNKIENSNPILTEIEINQKNAFALYNALKEQKEDVRLYHLKRSREDWTKEIKILFLLLKRKNRIYLMPDEDIKIEPNDELLIASDSESIIDFEYIINNYYELYYVLTGEEKSVGVFSFLGNGANKAAKSAN